MSNKEDRDWDNASAAAAAASFDFIRFTLSDIHGIPRSRLIPRTHVKDALKNGISVSAGKGYVIPQHT